MNGPWEGPDREGKAHQTAEPRMSVVQLSRKAHAHLSVLCRVCQAPGPFVESRVNCPPKTDSQPNVADRTRSAGKDVADHNGFVAVWTGGDDVDWDTDELLNAVHVGASVLGQVLEAGDTSRWAVPVMYVAFWW